MQPGFRQCLDWKADDCRRKPFRQADVWTGLFLPPMIPIDARRIRHVSRAGLAPCPPLYGRDASGRPSFGQPCAGGRKINLLTAMNPLRISRTLLALCAFATLHALTLAASALSKEDIAETAKWFDGLTWPDLAGKPYVEIMFGKSHVQTPVPGKTDAEDHLVDGPTVRGFLLAEDAKGFTIFADGTVTQEDSQAYRGWPLAVQRIEKSWQDASPEFAVTSRVVELPAAVGEALAAARRPKKQDKYRADSPPKIPKGVALFGLARCCVRAGRADLAARLDAELLTLADPAAWVPGGAEMSFRAAVENGIAHALMWKAMEDCGRGDAMEPGNTVKRTEVLAEFARIARDFPGSADHAEATRLAEMLRKMVAEDEAHPKYDDRQIGAMSREERVREWIFQLRDQSYFPGYMTDMPASTPVDVLVSLGAVAVSALLETLGDERITRSVVRNHGSIPSHILTVADCAEDALSRIAGRDFGFHLHDLPAVRDAERAAARRHAIEAWWKGYQRKGEKAVLTASVRAGGFGASEKARRLAEMDPPAAVAAMAVGLCATKDETAREHLIQILGQIESDASSSVLRREMLHDPIFECRVHAAWALLSRGAKDAGPAMADEFREWKLRPTNKRAIDPNDPSGLIAFLGACGDLTAMKALGARMPKLPTELRAEIAAALIARVRNTPIPEKVEALGEQIAISALQDRSTVGFGERVCDIAAEALAERWPERYVFHNRRMDPPDAAAGSSIHELRLERDPQIIAIANVWCAAHGQKALPLPERPSHPLAERDANVVAACRWSGGKPLAGLPIAVGKPLTKQSLLAAFAQLQRALPKACKGVALSAERLGDHRGCVVEIEWIPGIRAISGVSWKTHSKGGSLTISYEPPGGNYESSLSVQLARKSLYSGEGGTLPDEPGFVVNGKNVRAIEKALAGAPDQAMAIYFGSERTETDERTEN